MYSKRKWIQPQGVSQRSETSRLNNAQGRLMEDMILGACRDYERRGIARIVKVPEPFRVVRNTDRGQGIATVRFTGRAEPDFVGCLAGGRMIAFESKYTTADRIQQRVVTDAQARALKSYTRIGASTYICCGIGTGFDLEYFMVPWAVWQYMDITYGRKYMTRDDAKMYRVEADAVIHFLDNI